jgi:hypothetical protein
LDHPIPAEDSAFLAVGLLGECGCHTSLPQTPSGLPRSTLTRTNRGGRLFYRGSDGCPFALLRRSRRLLQVLTPALAPTSPIQPFAVTWVNAASSKIHSHSPVRSSPGPVATFRLAATSGFIPRFGPRRYQQRPEESGMGLDTSPEVPFTRRVQLRVARRVREARHRTSLPSEPCLRLSPHTAQATADSTKPS